MDWYKRMVEICAEYGIEPMVVSEGILQFTSSEIPSPQVRQQLEKVIPPEFQVQFIQGPKVTILNQICMLIKQAGGLSDVLPTQDGILNIASTLKGDHPVWDEVETVAKTDKFIIQIKRTYVDPLRLGVKQPPVIKSVSNKKANLDDEIEKNQETGQDITKDDILNLQIKLGQAETIDDFLNALK